MGLSGYYIGIDGSSSPTDDPVLRARVHSMMRALARAIFSAGGGIVTLVSKDPRAEEGGPDTALTFIWTLLEEVDTFAEKHADLGILCRAVLSPKTPSERVPAHRQEMWARLQDRGVVDLKYVEEKKHLGMNLRKEQAERGDALVVVGGGKGVLDLADRYCDDRRPVIPLDADLRGISDDGPGAAALNAEAFVAPERFAPSAPDRLLRELPLLSFRAAVDPPERIAERLTRLLSDILEGQPHRRPVSRSSLLHEIHQAAMHGGLSSKRDALLVGIDRDFKASLPDGDSPAALFLTDLGAMIETPRLRDGSQPLRQWLENACVLLANRPEAAVMQRALRLLISPAGGPFSRR